MIILKRHLRWKTIHIQAVVSQLQGRILLTWKDFELAFEAKFDFYCSKPIKPVFVESFQGLILSWHLLKSCKQSIAQSGVCFMSNMAISNLPIVFFSQKPINKNPSPINRHKNSTPVSSGSETLTTKPPLRFEEFRLGLSGAAAARPPSICQRVIHVSTKRLDLGDLTWRPWWAWSMTKGKEMMMMMMMIKDHHIIHQMHWAIRQVCCSLAWRGTLLSDHGLHVCYALPHVTITPGHYSLQS